MAQAATPEGLGLPCSPRQALALYQLLFRHPAGLGHLQAALRQVHEDQGCPSGLELSAVLLEMERRQRAQEQLLWDLELLTGAGLGLFWPPWARFYGQRHQAKHAWNQDGRSPRRRGGDSEQLGSRLPPLLQAGDSLSQNHQLLEGPSRDLSYALDLGEAGSDTEPRWEVPGSPAEAVPGCLEELNSTINNSFPDPGNSEFKDLEERSQVEPVIQRPHRWTSRNPQEQKLTQGAPEPSGLAAPGLPAPQDPLKGLGCGLGQERPEPQTLLRVDPPQGQREEGTQGQSGESPQSQREEARQGENKEPNQGANSPQCQRKEAQQGQEMKILQSWEGNIPRAWELAKGDVTVQPLEEAKPPGHPREFCRSLGEQIPQRGERESPSPRERTTQLAQVKTQGQRQESTADVAKLGTVQEPEWALLPAPMPGARSWLPDSGGGMPMALSTRGCGQQELPAALLDGSPSPAGQEVDAARLQGRLGEPSSGPGGPKASKTAWPAPLGRNVALAGVSVAQQETALQRLLELHRAARLQRRRDREQQRLRVLERLRIAGNRHRRIHPLGLPPTTVQFAPQEDEAGRRRALRQQLEQVHQERTRWLRALRARNTQNFQELLSPVPRSLTLKNSAHPSQPTPAITRSPKEMTKEKGIKEKARR